MAQSNAPQRMSFLTSLLARHCEGVEASAFRARYPHAWILWEPGQWAPPAPNLAATVMVDLRSVMAPRPGEALAHALMPQPARNEVTLGRAPTCDIPINDRTLSQVHLVFVPQPGGGWAVRDAGSKNGANLDGVRLASTAPVPLKDGSRLVCAQVTLTFHSPEGLHARLSKR